MEVDAAAQRAVAPQHGPSTAGHRVALVVALPRELNTRTAVARRVAAIDLTFDGDESEAACALLVELDEGGADQVQVIPIPELHLHDSPPTRDVRHLCPPADREPGLVPGINLRG